MNKIVYDLREQCKSQLTNAIGSEIQIIYADRMIKEYGVRALEASFFILKLGKLTYIKFTTNWFECSETLDSYYSLEVEDVDFSIEQSTSIFSFGNTGVIRSISIAQKEIRVDKDYITHSFGIVILRNDSKRIFITGGESAFQNTVLSDDEEYISNALKEATLVCL